MAEAQGFDISQNLGESNSGDSDRRILSNLVETGIEGDFILFAGNLRAFSEIDSNTFTVDANGKCTITEVGILPFSDETPVSVVEYTNETDQQEQSGASTLRTLTTFGSNGTDSFRLKDENGNPVTDSSLFKGALLSLRRSDTVTNANLQNVKRTRIPAVDPAQRDTTDIGNLTILGGVNVAGAYANADSSISVLQFAKQSVPLTFRDSILTNKNIVFDGNIRILNASNVAVAGNDDAPGLFIVAGTTPLRAFSDTSNPWDTFTNDSVSGPSLKTSASTATVATIQIKNDNTLSANGTVPEFKGTWSQSISSSSGPITDFTHKIPVKIDGNTATVFLLVKV